MQERQPLSPGTHTPSRHAAEAPASTFWAPLGMPVQGKRRTGSVGLEGLDFVARGENSRVLSGHELTESGAEVLVERLFILLNHVILPGPGGGKDSAGASTRRGILERESPAVQGSGDAPALVELVVIPVTKGDDLAPRVPHAEYLRVRQDPSSSDW